jgi:hypothetical protein
LKSEAHHKSEQVLKIRKPTRRWWGQVLADIILPDQFAETVAEIHLPEDSNIHTDVRPKDWSCRRKTGRGQRRRSAESNHALFSTGQMSDSTSGTQVRTDPAVSLPEVEQKIKNDRVLRTVSRLLVKRGAVRRGGVQDQLIPVPDVVRLDAEIIV